MTDLSKKTVRDEDGVQQVTIEDAPDGTTLQVIGRRFVATLSGSTSDDFQPMVDIELQGVVTEVKDFTDGDYIDLDVVMPGDPEVVLSEYAKSIFIKPSGKTEVVASNTATLPAGLIIRATYVSIATSGSNPVVYMDYRLWQ